MPSDLMSLLLNDGIAKQPHPVLLQPLDPTRIRELADAYFNAYPAGVACATVDEAVQEIRETFAGAYGVLRHDASAMALNHDRAVGAIMVVERSIWDTHLPGPFIIDLFVDPAAQSTGLGRGLVNHAIRRCAAAGDKQISLRVGEGTSLAAHALYKSLGFIGR